MNAFRNSFWLSLLIVSLSFSGWYFTRSNKVSLLDSHVLAKTNDMFIHDLVVHQFNEQGQLVNFLQTPLMRHTSEQNTHNLQTPHILIMQKDEPNWDISAKEAISIHGGKKIIFKDHVVIHQAAGTNTPENTITTEEISYYPEKKTAVTSLAVTFTRPGSIVKSQGLKAYLADKRVILLNKAQGIFEPQQG